VVVVVVVALAAELGDDTGPDDQRITRKVLK
jgi:hypothetical protein